MKIHKAYLYGLGDIRFVEEARRALGPTEVRLDTLLAGMNPGTSLAYFSGSHPRMGESYVPLRHPRKRLELPRPLSGAGVGRVIEIGADVKEVKEGDILHGIMSYSPQSIVEVGNFRKVSAEANLEEYGLSTQALVALNAIHRSGLSLGDDVAVIGQGPIGLAVTRMARLAGANVVIANDLHENRLALAREVGADHAVGQPVLDHAGGQAGQRQIPLGHEVPHRPLVRVDADEGQGDDDEGDRQHCPQEELGVQAAEPAHDEPPHSIAIQPRRSASVTASVRLFTRSLP